VAIPPFVAKHYIQLLDDKKRTLQISIAKKF
jgi:hypothetical protein